MGLDISFERAGGRVLRTQVGDRYVVEKMRAENFTLGGEQSGHLIFHNISTTGDGILAALCLLEVLLEQEKPLSELKNWMTKFPQVMNSIPVHHKKPLNELPELEKQIHLMQEKLGKQGRILFRYSGTEHKARIMIEGPDEGLITQMLSELSFFTQKELS